MRRQTTALVTALALNAGLGLAACGNDDAGDTMTPDDTMSASPAMSTGSMDDGK